MELAIETVQQIHDMMLPRSDKESAEFLLEVHRYTVVIANVLDLLKMIDNDDAQESIQWLEDADPFTDDAATCIAAYHCWDQKFGK